MNGTVVQTSVQDVAVEEASGSLAGGVVSQPAGSLVGEVRGRLERLIINGDIAPGSRLNELALSQRMEVSRSVVREAARLLERSGLVVLHPNRGVFVRRVSLKEALDLFDIRAGLALVAGRLAASRADAAGLAALRDLHARMVAAVPERRFDAYYDLNLDFHAAIMAASGNPRLASLDRMMSDELHLFRRRNLGQAAQLEASSLEHARILEAIAHGDGARAGRAFERHVRVGRQRMLDTLSGPETDA